MTVLAMTKAYRARAVLKGCSASARYRYVLELPFESVSELFNLKPLERISTYTFESFESSAFAAFARSRLPETLRSLAASQMPQTPYDWCI